MKRTLPLRTLALSAALSALVAPTFGVDRQGGVTIPQKISISSAQNAYTELKENLKALLDKAKEAIEEAKEAKNVEKSTKGTKGTKGTNADLFKVNTADILKHADKLLEVTESLHQQNEALRIQVENADTKLRGYDKLKGELDLESRKNKNLSNSFVKEIATLKGQLTEKDKMNENLKTQLEALRIQNENLKTQLEKEKIYVIMGAESKLKDERAQTKINTDQLHKQIKDLQDQVIQKEKTNSAVIKENQALKNQQEKKREDIIKGANSELKYERAQTKINTDQLHNQIKDLKDLLEQKQKDLVKTEKLLDDALKGIKNEDKFTKEAKDTIRDLQNLYDKSSELVEKKDSDIKFVRNYNADLLKRNAALAEENEKVCKERDEIRARLRTDSNAKDLIAEKNTTIAKLKAAFIKTLTIALEKAALQKEALQKEGKTDQIAQKEKEIEVFKAYLKSLLQAELDKAIVEKSVLQKPQQAEQLAKKEKEIQQLKAELEALENQ